MGNVEWGRPANPLAAGRDGAITLLISSDYKGWPALAVRAMGAGRRMSAGPADPPAGASILPPGSFLGARRTRA